MQLKPNSTSEFTGGICINVPPYINSGGLWVPFYHPRWWLNNSLPLLELQLIVLGISMAITHFILKRVGFVKISSQIITGLIYGCSWYQWDSKKYDIFRVQSEEILALLAYFGFMLFFFMSSVKMDVRTTMTTGRKAWIIGIPSYFIPLLCCFLVGTIYRNELSMEEKGKLPLMVGLHGMISFPVIASLLSELKIVSSELGRLGLSAALVSDMFSQFIVVGGNYIRIVRQDATKGYLALGGLVLQLLLISFVFRPAVLWIVKRTPDGKPMSRNSIQGVLFLVLLSAIFSTLLGQPALFGPFILGLAVPDGDPLGSSLVEKLECFVSEIFMPIFVILCAKQVDLSKIFVALGDTCTQMDIIMAFLTFTVKVASCFLCSLYCNLSFKDSLALSLILSCKGVVELSLVTVIRQYKIIKEEILAWFTVTLLLIATFVPMAVKCLCEPSRRFAGRQNRNIMNLNENSELRVLAVVHRNENIYGITHVLNLSSPRAQNPLAVYVLHLIELIGRTTPIFISHRLEKKAVVDHPYTENVILSFEHFERENAGTVYAECFTAITPHKFMYDDICKLAHDKITSLIILPFHQTWTTDGLLDQEDLTMRTLNCSVIERAPCSVGIFVDRGCLGSTASSGTNCQYSVCLIFLGGSDDREAISYAKRIAKDSRIDLTLLRLTSPLGDGSSNWEKMLDAEILRDFKTYCLGDVSVKFLEEVCEDGPQTALRLRKYVNDYDLIIVGRRNGLKSPQTAGLSEWSEFPELGILGDLIASLDMNTKTSVLVIQQRI